MNVNKVIIIGRLTRDPEIRNTQTGQNVANFSVATSAKWKDQSGQSHEKVEFHNVIAWGKQAEVIVQYMTKGQEIYVEGRLETKSWDDKDTNKKMYKTEIVLEKFEFGAKPLGNGQGNYQNNQKPQNTNSFSVQNNSNYTPTKENDIPTINLEDEEEIKIEDVPF
jgi:single-strand DNA-binding protein